MPNSATNYDPSQPRAPAGTDAGGQWISRGAFEGLSAEARMRHIRADGKIFDSAAHLFDSTEINAAREVQFKSRDKLISMPIKDFLAMAEAIPGGASQFKAERVVEQLKTRGYFSSLPFLMFKTDGGEATAIGHEGRHRAMALQRLGYTHLPVILRGDIRWSEQSDPSRFDYREKWPTVLHGQSGGSIKFPVRREDAEKSFNG